VRGSIVRRGKKWAVIVDVACDAKGHRKQRWHSGFETKRDASRALTEILASLQAGAYVEPSKQTVAGFMREWLSATKATVRPSTWASYRLMVESHIVPGLGAMSLQQLAPSMLNAFYAELLASGRRDGKGGLSARTVRYVHMIVRRSLSQAVHWQRLTRNVADQADPPHPHAGQEMRTWTALELRTFFEHVSTDRFYAAFVLAGTTGMRRGEVLGLRWRDLDLDAGRAAIRQTLLSVGYAVLFSTPKTAKGRRSIALDAVTVASLREHRRRQLEERLAFGRGYGDQDLVFVREDGSPVHPDYFSERFERAEKDAGLPRIRLHDLRHTHATLALQAGVHAKVVSERLGHATVGITLDTYSHAIPAMEEEAAARVAAIVFGA
jgi:integrase